MFATKQACYNSKDWESASQNSGALWMDEKRPPHTHPETMSARGRAEKSRFQLGNKNFSFSGCMVKHFLSSLCPKNPPPKKVTIYTEKQVVSPHPFYSKVCKR